MSNSSCSDVCDAIIYELIVLGFQLNDDDNHDDILDALEKCEIRRKDEQAATPRGRV